MPPIPPSPFLFRVKGSYFGECERDDQGHCLPSGQAGQQKPEEGNKPIPPGLTGVEGSDGPGKVAETRKEERKQEREEKQREAAEQQKKQSQDAVAYYQTDGFYSINEALRGKFELSEQDRQAVEVLDRQMTDNVGGRVLYRGLGNSSGAALFAKLGFDRAEYEKRRNSSTAYGVFESLANQFGLTGEAKDQAMRNAGVDPDADRDFLGVLQAAVGKEYEEPGYTSTSSSGQMASYYRDDDKGEDGLLISFRTPANQLGVDVGKLLPDDELAQNQRETILPRGLKFKVVGLEPGGETGWRMTVDVVGEETPRGDLQEAPQVEKFLVSPSPFRKRLPLPPSPFRKRLSFFSVKSKDEHRYGCLLGQLPADISTEIAAWAKKHIPDEWLGTEGREDKYHVTVKYGFTGREGDVAARLQPHLSRHGPLSLKTGNFSYFEGSDEEGWPLILKVKSSDLLELNRFVSLNFAVIDTHPRYVPHVTIAYIKPEFIDSLVVLERLPFQQQDVVIDELEYSDADKVKTRIFLERWHDEGRGKRYERWGAAFSKQHEYEEVKHLTKGEGTCEPGQTAAQTGCTPASGDGGMKPEKVNREMSVEQGLNSLNQLPDEYPSYFKEGERTSSPGNKRSPFRFSGIENRRNVLGKFEMAGGFGAVDKSKDRKVNLSDLISTDPSISIAVVEDYLSKPLDKKSSGIVVKFQGKLWIVDGHHRLSSALLRGEKIGWVQLFDLDQKEQQIKPSPFRKRLSLFVTKDLSYLDETAGGAAVPPPEQKDAAPKPSALERAEHSDLITLPDGIEGTNCGNCEYIRETFCVHPEVNQEVTPRMCCKYWDAPGTHRSWESGKKNVNGFLTKAGSYFGECERDDEGHCLPSGQAGSSGGGEGKPKEKPKESDGSYADGIAADPELSSMASVIPGEKRPAHKMTRREYNKLPKVYRGVHKDSSTGEHVFITSSPELAAMHGTVHEFRLLPGTVIYPDPEVEEEFLTFNEGQKFNGEESLKLGSAVVSRSSLGLQKHEWMIERALAAGEEVPPDVLEAYPKLRARHSKEGTAVPPSPFRKKSVDVFLTKSDGTCKQGERSDLTGCTPASGEDGSLPSKEGEEKPSNVLSQLGSMTWDALKKAGHAVEQVEHAAKEWVERKVGERLDALPPTLQKYVRGVWVGIRFGTKAAFATYTAGQKVAELVAKERGATPEQLARLKAILSAVDIATFKPVSIAVGLTATPAVAGAASFIPLGSMTYLAYSTARDPLATIRAARKAVRGVTKKVTGGKAMESENRGLLGQIHDWLGSGEQADTRMTLFLAALDEMGNLKQALVLAQRTEKTSGRGQKGIKGSYFGECERDDQGHCLPSGEQGEEKLEEGKKPEGDERVESSLDKLAALPHVERGGWVYFDEKLVPQGHPLANELREIGAQFLYGMWRLPDSKSKPFLEATKKIEKKLIVLPEGVKKITRRPKKEGMQKNGTAILFRAAPGENDSSGDRPYFGAWSHYAESYDVGKEYTDNPGFGGDTLYAVTIKPEKPLDLRGLNKDDLVEMVVEQTKDVAASPWGNFSSKEEMAETLRKKWADFNLYETWENDKHLTEFLEDRYDWIQHDSESFPPGAITWVSIRGLPDEKQGKPSDSQVKPSPFRKNKKYI